MAENYKNVSIPMAFKLTLKQFIVHQEVVSLLALLYSLILLMFSWSVVSGDLPLFPNMEGLEGRLEGQEPTSIFPYLIIFIGPLIFGAIYQSCLSRILARGQEGLYLANKGQMLNDAIKALKFMFQGMLFIAIWAVPMLVIFSMIAAGSANPLLTLIALALLVISLVAGIAITQALYVSIAGIGRSEHIPLKEAWENLGGLKLRFGLYMIVIFLGLYIVNGLLINILAATGLSESMPRFSSAFSFVVYSFLTSLSTFLYLGMADLIAKKPYIDIST